LVLGERGRVALEVLVRAGRFTIALAGRLSHFASVCFISRKSKPPAALPRLLQELAYATRFNIPGTGIGVTNRDWRC